MRQTTSEQQQPVSFKHSTTAPCHMRRLWHLLSTPQQRLTHSRRPRARSHLAARPTAGVLVGGLVPEGPAAEDRDTARRGCPRHW